MLDRMSLIENKDAKVSVSTNQDYELGEGRREYLQKILPEFLNKEYWDPVYQAWRPFLDIYLTCGCDPELTKQYGSSLMSKEDYLNPPTCRMSDMFRNVTLLRNSTGTEIFKDVLYPNIEYFVDQCCSFFLQKRKVIITQLYSPDMYLGTMRALLNRGTWKGFMCALILYRHCQNDDFTWSIDVTAELDERLEQWIETTLKAFDTVCSFLDGRDIYDWYCSDVRAVIKRSWSTALQLTNRPGLLTPRDISNISVATRELLISYVNSLPVIYDEPYRPQTVFDVMYNVFYEADGQSPTYCEEIFHTMCVPISYFKRMCNVLFEFYWIVKDGKLTGMLIDRKHTEYSKDPENTVSPEEYWKDLQSRGFPIRREE